MARVVAQADDYRRDQMALQWPELANVLAELIELFTAQDAPRNWWTHPDRHAVGPAIVDSHGGQVR